MNNQYGYYNMPSGNGYYPPQNGYYPPQGMVNNQVFKPKKKKIWLIIFMIVVLLLLVGFIFWKVSSSKNRKYTFELLKDTNAFFLPNGDGYYALFNEDGKRLTDFQFDNVGEFYGGVAKVEREDGKVAIIKENGSYLLNFTEDTITDYQTLFLIKSSDSSKMKLINYEGKKLLEEDSIRVIGFDDSSLFVVTTGDSKTVKVMNYKGDVLEELDNSSNFSKSQEVIHGLVTLIDSKKTYLYNIDSGKKLYETEGSYCITGNEGNSTVLSSCSSNTKIIKALKDNQEVYSVSKSLCGTLEIMEDGNFICKNANNNVYHFLNTDGSIGEELIASYHNQKDYVVKSGTGLIFYVDNKERYRSSCVNVDKTIKDGYIIKNYTYGECTGTDSGIFFYSKTGEKNSSSFHQISDWDTNERAIVSNKANNYYLVNDKLEKVSRDYRSITVVNSFYVGMDESRNNKLFTVNQQEIEQGFKNYKALSRLETKGDILALIYDDKIVLYNSSNGNKIGENSGNSVSLFDHYYMINGSYYSYQTGEQFYTKE